MQPPREVGTGAADGGGIGVGWRVGGGGYQLPNCASLHALNSNRADVSSNCKHAPFAALCPGQGWRLLPRCQEETPAKRKGAHTYCSRPPSLGSGRKEREQVTDAALGPPTSLLGLFPTPRCPFRALEIIAAGGPGELLTGSHLGAPWPRKAALRVQLKCELREGACGDQSEGERRAPKVRGRKGEMGRPGAGVPLTARPSQAFPLRQGPLPVTYQRGRVIHVNHGVLQRRKPKQGT